MRWVFILLIALNLLVYVQHNQLGSAEVGQPAPPSNGIRLLSELGDPARSGHLSTRLANAECGILGGFEQEADALALRERLKDRGIEARLEPVDTDAGTDYWVYLPPLLSRQAAVRQLKDLQARNIDSYIVTVGPLVNGISLGIFSRLDTAESLQRRLLELDYGARIRELARAHRSYRLALDGVAWQRLNDLAIEPLAKDFPSLRLQQNPCDGIATFE